MEESPVQMKVSDCLLLAQEVVEEVLRTKTFLLEVERLSPDEDRGLVRAFRKRIDFLQKHIGSSIEMLVKRDLGDEVDNPKLHINPCYNVAARIRGLQHQLRYFVHIPEIPREVYTFVLDVFPVQLFPKLEPTVVYRDRYMYGQFFYSERWDRPQPLTGTAGMIKSSGAASDIGIGRNVLLLPYADSKNALMWMSLVHEMGHAVAQRTDVWRELMPEEAPGEEMAQLRRWANEIFADRFSLRLVGPACLDAFMVYQLCREPEKWLPSRTHPQPQDRILNMYDN